MYHVHMSFVNKNEIIFSYFQTNDVFLAMCLYFGYNSHSITIMFAEGKMSKTDILERIEIKMTKLSAKQQEIALAVLRDPLSASYKSVKELSESVGTSAATIVRFAQEMTEGGYPQLQAELREYIQNLSGPIERMGLNTGVNDEDDAFLLRIYETQVNNLRLSFNQSSVSAVKAAADLILGAEHIYTFGFRGPSSISYYLGHHLNRILKNTDFVRDDDRMADWLYRVTEKDVAIFVCLPRYSRNLLTVAKRLKSIGTKLILIDSSPNSPFALLSDVSIYVSYTSNDFHNSLLSAMLISEMLISLVASRRKDMTLRRLNEIEPLFNELEEFYSPGAGMDE